MAEKVQPQCPDANMHIMILSGAFIKQLCAVCFVLAQLAQSTQSVGSGSLF